MDGAPPPYEDNSKPSMYPTPNDGAPQYQQQAPYQPNMTNPYPPYYSAPPTAQHYNHHQQQPAGAGVQQQPTQHVYVNSNQYGSSPVTVTCPHCHQNTVSKLKFSAGLLAWILFGVLLLFGCWMGCCLIPFCMESCQDCEHYCSNCNHYLGMYKRL